MAKSEELSTDWTRSAGDFSCSSCGRKRLPACEFSKKQVEKLLASLKTIPDKDIRTGPDISSVVYLTGVCKKCTEEKEQKERADAQAKRDEREAAAEEATIEPPEKVEVVLAQRPLGMTPASKAPTGYRVLKASEGKPAAKAGVKPGWRLVSVAGKSCEDQSLEEAQATLKGAELPVTLTFEAVPGGADFCINCQEILAIPLFSRKMRTRLPEKRRCSACVEASEAAGEDEAEGAAPAEGGGSKLSELQQLCRETAKEAEKVTGIKAVGRGGRGKGRGRGGYS
eukprot:TRINITY_DN54411_c0_g1_i1.p1 TRINITY_DN54411_c0_g1~~TRINITY_DN54411_c0_g1_i1.p1  ORF type:complete len:283 (+),score=81.18 TRINITY_DN54411_c0_g1_i1:38-886(+)